MRVISGVSKGHKLLAPNGLETRPTSDRIKETLFNIISPDIYNINFLDLFAGSGAIGIEALSRGANKAVFVDNSPKCIDIINYNLNHTKLYEKSEIYCCDVISVMDMFKLNKQKFDIIFMDPPYNLDFYESVITNIKKSNIISSDGYIILESSSKVSIPIIDGFKLLREKIFKTTTISFLALVED